MQFDRRQFAVTALALGLLTAPLAFAGADEDAILKHLETFRAAQAAGHAPGVGLGLALCRRLARAMRGDLVLEAGPGAVFSLHLRTV